MQPKATITVKGQNKVICHRSQLGQQIHVLTFSLKKLYLEKKERERKGKIKKLSSI